MSVHIRRWMYMPLLGGFFAAAPCLAQQLPEPPGMPTAEGNLLGAAFDHVSEVAEQGRWDLYLSGYAHHSRDTYSRKRLQKLNEKAWGAGFGKTVRNERGNDESLYALVIRDSNRNLQWSAGYSYQWIFPVAATGLEAGAGLSAGLIQRKDWFDGVPFPAVVPVFSLGSSAFKLMASYVPRMSTRRGKGDVLFLFLKSTF